MSINNPVVLLFLCIVIVFATVIIVATTYLSFSFLECLYGRGESIQWASSLCQNNRSAVPVFPSPLSIF